MVRKLPPRLLKYAWNAWMPFFGAGIRVKKIAPDFREIIVELPLRFCNRNHAGAHFGGSIYAMTDPFFALMMAHNLPGDYVVMDKAGAIDFLAPGRGRVRARLKLEQHDLDLIARMTAGGDKHLHLFHADVVDGDGLTVAHVEKLVYVRRKEGGGATRVASAA